MKQERDAVHSQLEASERQLEEVKVRENVLKASNKVIAGHMVITQLFMCLLTGTSRRTAEGSVISCTSGASAQSRYRILEHLASNEWLYTERGGTAKSFCTSIQKFC